MLISTILQSPKGMFCPISQEFKKLKNKNKQKQVEPDYLVERKNIKYTAFGAKTKKQPFPPVVMSKVIKNRKNRSQLLRRYDTTSNYT